MINFDNGTQASGSPREHGTAAERQQHPFQKKVRGVQNLQRVWWMIHLITNLLKTERM